MTTLEEMGRVMRAVPGPHAGVHEIADWYTRKAHLLDRLAAKLLGDCRVIGQGERSGLDRGGRQQERGGRKRKNNSDTHE